MIPNQHYMQVEIDSLAACDDAGRSVSPSEQIEYADKIELANITVGNSLIQLLLLF
jgi:hypothetical protein